jgi:hypothetical protein
VVEELLVALLESDGCHYVVQEVKAHLLSVVNVLLVQWSLPSLQINEGGLDEAVIE